MGQDLSKEFLQNNQLCSICFIVGKKFYLHLENENK